MATSIINDPRIDVRFVKPDGTLTEYAYKLLAQLVRRGGGAVSDVLDGREVSASLAYLGSEPAGHDDMALHSLSVTALTAPAATHDVQQRDIQPPYVQVAEPVLVDARVQSLEAELAALRVQVNGLLQGYQL